MITYSKLIRILCNSIFDDPKLRLYYLNQFSLIQIQVFKKDFYLLKLFFIFLKLNEIHKNLKEYISSPHAVSSAKNRKHDNFKLNDGKAKLKISKYLNSLIEVFRRESIQRNILEIKENFMQKLNEKNCNHMTSGRSLQNMEKYFEDFMRRLVENEKLKK